ncbi:hypothetical protein IZY60_08930 [Lutibacter sp. B2]|nr:hypothetical protein [Lutibacter sp. B2]
MYIIKQTIAQKKLSFWKVAGMIVGTIWILDLSIKLLTKNSPVIGTIGGLIAFIVSVALCMFIIYKHISYYNYKLIGDELMMERVFGRASHLFLNLKLQDIDLFVPYKQMDFKSYKNTKVKRYKFVSGKNIDDWYVGEFVRSGERYRFIFEPNKEMLNAIKSFKTI